MRHNRRGDGQLSCRKSEMKTMNTNNALVGHTTENKLAERGDVPLTLMCAVRLFWSFLSPNAGVLKGSVERSSLPSAIFLIFTRNRP